MVSFKVFMQSWKVDHVSAAVDQAIEMLDSAHIDSLIVVFPREDVDSDDSDELGLGSKIDIGNIKTVWEQVETLHSTKRVQTLGEILGL